MFVRIKTFLNLSAEFFFLAKNFSFFSDAWFFDFFSKSA